MLTIRGAGPPWRAPLCDPCPVTLPPGTAQLAAGSDAALDASAAAPSCTSAGSELRRLLQPPLPRLRAADGADLRPGRDQGALHGALARAAAGAQHHPRTDPRLALAAAARGRRAPRPPPADAAGLPRRADALLRGGGRGDRRRRDRLLAAATRVPDPHADAGDHPGGDPAGRLRRRRRAAAGAPAPGALDGAGRDRLAALAADRPRHPPLPRRRRLRPLRESAEGGRRACSTPRSPSTAPGPTWPSARTSSRC